MQIDQKIAEVVSLLLWQHRAIEVREAEPFQLSSGNFTPLYINCRLLISYPSTREILTSFSQRLFHERGIKADCIAGGETAGIAFGAWLAQKLDKPFVYVRKKRKGHGTGSRLEGAGSGEALLFEDLITDGGSKLSFIEGIRDAGCTVSNCLVIVDREQGGADTLAKVGVNLYSLVTISTCLRAGRELGVLSERAMRQVEDFLAGPREWHLRRGLQFIDVAE